MVFFGLYSDEVPYDMFYCVQSSVKCHSTVNFSAIFLRTGALSSITEGGYDPLILCDHFLSSNAAKFAFKSINAEQIREANDKLKTSMSFGDNGISKYFLKLAMPVIEDSLVFLFNTSLETS